MAYKVFSNGDALTGGELNTFLMNQSVISFATTTARDAALTAPLEGQLVWLEDSNKYVYYTGSAWADLIVPASSGNAIINGAFDIWQRGTSFGTTTTNSADRWINFQDGTSTYTVSQQTFTPGSAPVAGYEGQFFLRYNVTSAGSGNTFRFMDTRLEDVRQFAGQTATFSVWLKADAARSVSVSFAQNFGTGGSSDVVTTGATFSVTTSWQRFSVTVNIPSVSGKTIGAGSFLFPRLSLPAGVTMTTDIWGVQLESGSSATPFRRNGVNIADELASCQRYYQRLIVESGTELAVSVSGTSISMSSLLPVQMRSNPSLSTTMTNANYGAGNWTFVQSGINSSTKSGTVTIQGAPKNQSFHLSFTGATYSPTPNGWQNLNNSSATFVELTSEL
jgi:hypothetical protein